MSMNVAISNYLTRQKILAVIFLTSIKTLAFYEFFLSKYGIVIIICKLFFFAFTLSLVLEATPAVYQFPHKKLKNPVIPFK